ncbi:uncharacterized protein LOC131012033 [Salvia miltiorrhiza]|uniref:uncharacterized protein LOC131012033 n=1 Tax=Salvia miltiorrhiza TaxID=226208 RepID=UPI0025AC0514|nr:uncharacterized protein LOC131012033 [Salvia miltiorrhiza]
MGICVSSHSTRTPEDEQQQGRWPSSAKVVDLEGRLEEFRQPVTAEEVLSRHPNCYLCSSDSMLINSNAPQFPKGHALQLGQIYFLMPLSKSLTPLSLEDLCHLAIKTSTALAAASHPFLHRCKTLTISSHENYKNIVTS